MEEDIQQLKKELVQLQDDIAVRIKQLNKIDKAMKAEETKIDEAADFPGCITGRLMHSEIAERHDIIMTESELSSYGKRLWALQEKGFTIKLIQS